MINTNSYKTDLGSSGLNARDGITYLLVGGGIGAVLALLFAPKSGREMRSDIADVSKRGYDLTLEKAGELKAHSTETLNSVREKATEIYDLAASKLNLSTAEIIDDVAKTATLKSASDSDSTSVRARNSSHGRKPASIF
ncbi:MAG: YtxH domain-containing protein [Pyrinomonadaceae bacterium]